AVGRVPATVQRKLLVALAIVVVLLVTVGVLGLRVLGESNDRVASLGQLPQRTAAYRELQILGAQLSGQLMHREDTILFKIGPIHDTTSADVAFVDAQIEATLNLLDPFTAVASLGFSPPSEEARILTDIRSESGQLHRTIPSIVANDQAAHYAFNQPQTDEATALESNADRLVSIAQRLTANLIAQNQTAYLDS